MSKDRIDAFAYGLSYTHGMSYKWDKYIPQLAHDEIYLFRDALRKLEQKEKAMRFQVINEHGLVVTTHETEGAAIANAEANAKSNPGKAYYVMKPITKSYVTPAPAVTTRL